MTQTRVGVNALHRQTNEPMADHAPTPGSLQKREGSGTTAWPQRASQRREKSRGLFFDIVFKTPF
jgi:hypothetical protein